MLKNNYLILLGFQEGEKDQLRDEAITRDITALVTSAFGGESSDSTSNGNTRPEIEVQQVTVYVDDGPNENKFSSAYKFITNRFWTTVASLGALFFNGVNLTQDVEQERWFHLTKHILILTFTYIMK